VVVDSGRVTVMLDRALYPLDVIYGASYVFVDRCYVLLDAPDAEHVQVELRARDALDEEALRNLAGEFGNELLNQAWRSQVTQNNRSVIEAVTAKAMAGALGPPDLDDAAVEEFEADAFDDPLGIAVPWEEKYGKQAQGAAEQAAEEQGQGPEQGSDEDGKS
jgi:His-Xaa-Ser system protein HxsD